MTDDLKQNASDTEVGPLWYILRVVIVMSLVLLVFFLLDGWQGGFQMDPFYNTLLH